MASGKPLNDSKGIFPKEHPSQKPAVVKPVTKPK